MLTSSNKVSAEGNDSRHDSYIEGEWTQFADDSTSQVDDEESLQDQKLNSIFNNKTNSIVLIKTLSSMAMNDKSAEAGKVLFIRHKIRIKKSTNRRN